METDGQFRFTPPTHAILAFWRTLQELEAEGGITGRASRYAENAQILIEGMEKLGFEPYLARQNQSHIITSFRYLKQPDFDFKRFYHLLSDQGFVIYPGKLSDADSFRIGTIGHIFPEDVQALLVAIQRSLEERRISRSQVVRNTVASYRRSSLTGRAQQWITGAWLPCGPLNECLLVPMLR